MTLGLSTAVFSLSAVLSRVLNNFVKNFFDDDTNFSRSKKEYFYHIAIVLSNFLSLDYT